MNSRFFYPTNAGSLGQPGRMRDWRSSIDYQATALFKVKRGGGQPITSVGKRTILVVEDDGDSRFILNNILSSKGYFVLEAKDGKEAVLLAETEKVNLILLDLELPKLNGCAVVSHLRETVKPESLPIVMMTAHEPEESRGFALAVGCDEFLPKPIDFDDLDAVLDQFAPLQ